MQRKVATAPEIVPVSKIKRADRLHIKELTKRVVVAKGCEGANISDIGSDAKNVALAGAASLRSGIYDNRDASSERRRSSPPEPRPSPPTCSANALQIYLRLASKSDLSLFRRLELRDSRCSSWFQCNLVVLRNTDMAPVSGYSLQPTHGTTASVSSSALYVEYECSSRSRAPPGPC